MTDFTEVFQKNLKHFYALQEIISHTRHEWGGCGSYLMTPATHGLGYDPSMLGKQTNLFEMAKASTRALEIGVHAGHSLLIMLIANPDLVIDCIDIPMFSHTEPCVKYLNEAYDNRITFYKGKSLDVIPTLTGPYDLIHVDGDHDFNVIRQEIDWIFNTSSPGTNVIFDDFDITGLREFVTSCPRLEIIDLPECKYTNCVCKFKG